MASHQISDDEFGSRLGSSLQQMLQLSVQSLQWTYSLFWHFCPQQGALIWADGYYNGAIKTRKMVQPVDSTAEEASTQRSLQLRELYESLAMGEDNQPSRRPCAALSPEDLTESEWFYLMCISFVFPPGEGLPGRALEKQETVWLAGANEADSKVFRRAILAKGAQIQTVVCIPIADGVLELGTTNRIEENETLIQLVRSFFSGYISQPPISESSASTPSSRRCHQSPAISPPPDRYEEEEDDDDDNDNEEEEDLSSQTEIEEEIRLAMSQEEELYSQTVSTILLQNPSPWTQNPSHFDLIRQSAFSMWTGGAAVERRRSDQWMLKNALKCRLRKKGNSSTEDLSASHVLAERRRREKLNERFITLRSMVPCVTKMDKASILGDTIEYMKKLLKRIQEMEMKMKAVEAWGEPERKKLKEMDAQLGFSREMSVQVSIIETDALLEFQCENKDGLLFRMMQTIHELGFQCVAVQSSVTAGWLVAQIRAKVTGATGRITSIMEVKKALHRLILH